MNLMTLEDLDIIVGALSLSTVLAAGTKLWRTALQVLPGVVMWWGAGTSGRGQWVWALVSHLCVPSDLQSLPRSAFAFDNHTLKGMRKWVNEIMGRNCKKRTHASSVFQSIPSVILWLLYTISYTSPVFPELSWEVFDGDIQFRIVCSKVSLCVWLVDGYSPPATEGSFLVITK